LCASAVFSCSSVPAAERFTVELGEQRHHPLVHAVGQQQDFDTQLAEDFEMRAASRRRVTVRGDVVDSVLSLLHPADVLGQRNGLLAGLAGRRREAQQLRDPLTVRGIIRCAFLEHAAEFLPEDRELLRLVPGEVFDEAEHALD
jgi:hypothetical protein